MINSYALNNRIRELEVRLEELKWIRDTKLKLLNKMGRPTGIVAYTEEEVNFLEECGKKKMTSVEVIRAFNKKFNKNIKETSRALYNLMDRCGFILPERRAP